MEWTGIGVHIHWTRSQRRRWPPEQWLRFDPEQRRKHCNVLLYWCEGTGKRKLPDGWVTIRPGDCHWAREGWTYASRQSVTDPFRVIAIHFDLIDDAGHLIANDEVELPPEQLRVSNPELVDAIIQQVGNVAMDVQAGVELDSIRAQAATAMFRGLLIMLDHETAATLSHGNNSRRGDAFNEITTYIHDHIVTLPSVSQLANHFGYSRSHFCRLFKRRIGITPQTYIIKARVAFATKLLLETHLSITQIAAQAGYSDMYRFSKQFKQISGASPTEYRRQFRSRSVHEHLSEGPHD